MSKILKMSLGILLFSTMLILYGCGGSGTTPSASNTQTIQSFVLNLEGNPTYISTESGQISGNKITLTTPVGTNAINQLTANITTADGVVHNNVQLSTDSQISNESAATTTYKVSTAGGITNGYIVTITIPQTLFSCIADTNESPAPASPCACLTQNDGSGLVWDVESMPYIIPYIFSSNNPVESAQNYLDTVFNPKSHCGYTDWGVPNSESYGAYASVSTFSGDGYYLWNIESSDQTDLGRLGYFAAHNSESSFNASESVAGFTGWLNQGPPVTPPLYANIAESMGMQPNWAFFISTKEPYTLLGISHNYQFFSGTYQPQSVYSGLVGRYYGAFDDAFSLLPVRGGQ